MTSNRFWRIQHRIAPYLFMAPFLVLFFAFFLYPLVRSLLLSFSNAVGPREVHFTGLTNYNYLIHDSFFWIAFANTLIYVLAFLLIQIPASLGLAMLLNSPAIRCRSFFRFAFFSTHLVGQVFVAVVFSQLLTPRHGLISNLLGLFSKTPLEIPWLSHPVLAHLHPSRVALDFCGFWNDLLSCGPSGGRCKSL